MLHLDFVSAEMMLQFGGLCFLTALLYTALLPGEEAWERLDAVRRDIDHRRETDEPSDDQASRPRELISP